VEDNIDSSGAPPPQYHEITRAGAVTWNGFHAGPNRIDASGERIWGIYTIEAGDGTRRAAGLFSDSKAAVSGVVTPDCEIPCAVVHTVKLPDKSELLRKGDHRGRTFLYDTAHLLGKDRTRCEVRGAGSGCISQSGV
jgi:hypothetical protein